MLALKRYIYYAYPKFSWNISQFRSFGYFRIIEYIERIDYYISKEWLNGNPMRNNVRFEKTYVTCVIGSIITNR